MLGMYAKVVWIGSLEVALYKNQWFKSQKHESESQVKVHILKSCSSSIQGDRHPKHAKCETYHVKLTLIDKPPTYEGASIRGSKKRNRGG